MRQNPLRILMLTGLVLMLFIAACSDDDSSGEPPSDAGDGSPSPTAPATTPGDETGTPGAPDDTATPEATGTEAAATATGTAGTGGGSGAGAGAGEGGTSSFTWDESVLELRDGTWPVGEAGEVEFTVVDADRLELVEARVADGWTETDRETEEDEIEVDFRRDNVEWKIQVEIDDGVLEIEIDQDIDGADPGTYTVGLAGTVEFSHENGRLTLIEAAPNGGWTHAVEEEDDDDIEVKFRRDNVMWDFQVDLDDGQIDVDIDFEIEGQFPA